MAESYALTVRARVKPELALLPEVSLGAVSVTSDRPHADDVKVRDPRLVELDRAYVREATPSAHVAAIELPPSIH